jgi:tetratricopeptide (TPR) repeat protein
MSFAGMTMKHLAWIFLLGGCALALGACSTTNPDEAYRRANLRFEEGDFDAAIADYTLVLQEDPRMAKAYNNRGVAYLRKGDPDAAIADFDACLAIAPAFAEARCNRGLARFRKGDLDGSIADYDEAIRLNPSYARAYAARGSSRGKKGDLEGAVADFRKALDVAPKDWPDRKALEAELEKTLKAREGK